MPARRSRMKFAVITPDRGDRPEFLERCKLYAQRQTLKATHIIVNDPPLDPNTKDIGRRIRLGLERAREAGCGVVAVFENDDFYHHTHFEKLVSAWARARCPPIYGINESIFYHARVRKWKRVSHPGRSSLCAMLIRPEVLERVSWADDGFPEAALGARLGWSGRLSTGPAERFWVGIKHGAAGLCGSTYHKGRENQFENDDADGSWLRGVVGEEDWPFYAAMVKTK